MNNEENQKHFEMVQKIAKINEELNEIDEYFDNLNGSLSEVELYISDLLHYVENNNFTPQQAVKFLNLLKKKRLERRKIKQDIVIKSNFDNIRNKFSFYDQRKIAMTQFFRKEKELMSEYNPRKISVVELKEMITGKRGRKSINANENFVGSSEIENEIMLSNNENIEENALYMTGETISYGDSCLILSTCDKYKEDGRFVVIAKKIQK